MIKRIIFDVDNTLIEWKDEYIKALKETIEKYNLDLDYIEVNNIIEDYEKYYDIYKIENLVELINKKTNSTINKEIIEDWLEKLANETEYNLEIENVMKKLNEKYELIILTNWFEKNQKDRMKKAGILKYIKEFYAGNTIMKPKEEAFKKACGNCKMKECIMVGDNYKIDIEPAKKLGINTIWIDKENKKTKENKNGVNENSNKIINEKIRNILEINKIIK